jgi:hypothetical protein
MRATIGFVHCHAEPQQLAHLLVAIKRVSGEASAMRSNVAAILRFMASQ